MSSSSVLERMTSQKHVVIEFLKETKSHPTAEMVYKEVKKKLPRVSRATVYRILKDLKEKGEIREIPCKVCRYDGDLTEHSHFFCEKCGGIIDVPEKVRLPSIKSKMVGKINNYQIYFYGVCRKCSRK
jgi:Fe2+ or Zn2+ uptake regulation protein